MPRYSTTNGYTGHPEKFDAILVAVRKDKLTPEKVDEQWLRSHGITNNFTQIPGIFKKLKLLNADSTPTDDWSLIRDQTLVNRIRLADLMKKEYSGLFGRYKNANDKSIEDIKKFFQACGQTEGTAHKQAKTFKILASLGDFDSSLDMVTRIPEVVGKIDLLEEAILAWRKSDAEINGRVRQLKPYRSRLEGLTLAANQKGPIADAITAAEAGLYSASHVLAWIGFTEFFYRPFVSQIIDFQDADFPMPLEEVRAKTDARLVRLGGTGEYKNNKKVNGLNLYSKDIEEQLLSMVSRRNKCAHGGEFREPTIHDAIDFLTDILAMIDRLRSERGWL
jgi:hypothetical protein